MEQTLLSLDWKAMAPEWVIAAGAAFLLVLDLLLKESASRKWIGALALLAVLVSGAFVLTQFGEPPRQILADSYRVDSFGLAFKAALLFGTALVILFSFILGKHELEDREGEYYYLLLFALLGGMMMVSSADLITLFVGLELLSLSSYILVGVRRKDPSSTEAAWKYVVLGGVSSAFVLYGMSFLYGIAGSTHLFTISERLAEAFYGGYQGFIYLSLFLMMVGFGFKIASAPFHMWTPDVYQGAATPITVFLAVVSKTAVFAFVVRTLLIAYLPLFSTQSWYEVVSWLLMILSAASMLIGSAVALKQTDAKRLLAYSGIAQAGYILVPFATVGFVPDLAMPGMFFYLVVYAFMTAGAFAVVEIVTREAGTGEVSAFAGLHQRSPWLAAAMTFLLLSLAGLPPAAGFFGKFYLLVGAIAGQQFWLAAVMVVATVISYYYYFEFIRQMYFRSSGESGPVRFHWPVAVVVLAGLIGTLSLGLWPDLLLDHLKEINWKEAIMMVNQGMQK
jgi:NADH-quinone oxidoreductase subunit N